MKAHESEEHEAAFGPSTTEPKAQPDGSVEGMEMIS